jgi:hypothetical protein
MLYSDWIRSESISGRDIVRTSRGIGMTAILFSFSIIKNSSLSAGRLGYLFQNKFISCRRFLLSAACICAPHAQSAFESFFQMHTTKTA